MKHCQWSDKHHRDKNRTQTAPSRSLPSQLQILLPANVVNTSKNNKHEHTFFRWQNWKKNELSKDIYQTTIRMKPMMTGGMKVSRFHSQFRKEALKIFRIINASKKYARITFRRKYVRAQPQAAPKHYRQKLTFDASTKSLSNSHEKLNEWAEKAFGHYVQQMMDGLLYDKISPDLKRSLGFTYLKMAHAAN